MKIADLFGAGVPVLALDYGPCLREQVREGENGLLFTDAAGLAGSALRTVQRVSRPTPVWSACAPISSGSHAMRWEEGWKAEAAAIFAPNQTSG